MKYKPSDPYKRLLRAIFGVPESLDSLTFRLSEENGSRIDRIERRHDRAIRDLSNQLKEYDRLQRQVLK